MNYDHSLEALIRPGNADRYFQFDKMPALYVNSHRFEISNACLLAELCRLIYHPDQTLYCGDEKISFIETALRQRQIQWLDCFKHDDASVYSWLLRLTAFDRQTQRSQPVLLLIFRGSTGFDNWKLNANALQTRYASNGSVHNGFLDAFRHIEQQIADSDDLKKLPVLLAGHSLGAALAVLTKARFDEQMNIDSCYTFGAPRVGNRAFAESMKQENVYRIINRNDVVTMLPFDFLANDYHHVGQAHYFTGDKHYIGYLDPQIRDMQQQDLPKLKRIGNLDGLLSMLKNLERDIPSYLSDHAPINYLARLNREWQG